MYSKQDFLADVLQIAGELGYTLETCRGRGYSQIDFGNKKLHADHIQKLYPAVLEPNADIKELIEQVAPGRPCTHAPFSGIVRRIRAKRHLP